VPPFVYKDAMNLVLCLPIRRSPLVFMNVAMWEHYTLEN
jgi:hypothetical protein